MPGLTKVFVGNLSFSTKEPELAQEFAAAGKVVNANIITRGPRSLGYGFVEFENEQDAQNAVKVMDKKEVQGRQVNVELARPQDEIKKEEQQEQQPQRTRGASRGGRGTFRGRPGRGRGRRTFRRRDGEDNEQAPAANQSGKQNNEGDKAKDSTKARPPRERRPTENREESQTTLFVANLPFGLDDAGFGKFITDLGLKFKSAHVVTKRNGRSKGYGFVEFDNHDDQQKALQAIDKKEVEGRALSVKVALTEPPKSEEHESKEEKKEEKKDENSANKETKKEEKKEPVKKEEKKEVAAKSPQTDKKENKPAPKSPQQKK